MMATASQVRWRACGAHRGEGPEGVQQGGCLPGVLCEAAADEVHAPPIPRCGGCHQGCERAPEVRQLLSAAQLGRRGLPPLQQPWGVDKS
jgi:hypothetical protein